MKTFNITGVIGGWYGVTAAELRRQFPKDKKEEFKVVLNTNGGDVFEGFAIYQLLDEFENVVIEIGAMVASAGSYAILAAMKVYARSTSSVMIHKAGSIIWGNADDMHKEANVLDDIDSLIASRYALKTGKSKESFIADMKDELWLIGGEAIVDYGIADELISDGNLSDEAIVNVKRTVTASIKNFKNELYKIKMGESPPENKHLSNSIKKEEPELKNDKTAPTDTDQSPVITEKDVQDHVQAERSRMTQILNVSGLKIPTGVANALNSGQSYPDFCVALAETPKTEDQVPTTNVAAIGTIAAAPEASATVVETAPKDKIKAELDAMWKLDEVKDV